MSSHSILCAPNIVLVLEKVVIYVDGEMRKYDDGDMRRLADEGIAATSSEYEGGREGNADDEHQCRPVAERLGGLTGPDNDSDHTRCGLFARNAGLRAKGSPELVMNPFNAHVCLLHTSSMVRTAL